MVWSGACCSGRQDHGIDAGPVDAGFQIGRLKWDLPFFRERLAPSSYGY